MLYENVLARVIEYRFQFVSPIIASFQAPTDSRLVEAIVSPEIIPEEFRSIVGFYASTLARKTIDNITAYLIAEKVFERVKEANPSNTEEDNEDELIVAFNIFASKSVDCV